VIVEAGRRSGALNTARHARDLGRKLMAVPGPVTSDLSAGCHSIIRDWGAALVTCADDVLEFLSPVGAREAGAREVGVGERAGATRGRAAVPADVPVTASPRDTPSREDLLRDRLDLEAATVLDALPVRGGRPTLEIAVLAGLDPSVVLAKLGMLAVYGLAERTDRGWRCCRPGGRPPGTPDARPVEDRDPTRRARRPGLCNHPAWLLQPSGKALR
jgi:DNA processing protein